MSTWELHIIGGRGGYKLVKNIVRRYYQNVSLLGAYSRFDFLKQLVSFPLDYYARGGRSSFPLNITLALTLRCNARCSMCALSELLNADSSELSLEQYKRFIDSCVKMKPGFVLYGGEPFLRPDILEIIRIIKNHRLSCGIFTNGTLLNKNILKEIIQLKVNFVAFSLYGTKEIHDKIVGVNGAYEKLIENASFLKNNRKNTKVVIHCTVSEQNVGHLDDVSNIGVSDSVRFGHLTFVTSQAKEKIIQELKRDFPGQDISFRTHVFNPDLEKSKEFADNLNELKKKGNAPFTPELSRKEIIDWYNPDFKSLRKCFFVWRGVFIAPNGDVYPCMGNFYYKMGNILDEDLLKIWNNDKFINFRLALKKGLLSACARCCRL